MTTTPPPGPTRTSWGVGSDPWLGAAALRAQAASGRTPVLKPSSNSTVPVAWITEPAMDSW